MLDSLKDCYSYFLPSLIKKHLNEHITYNNFSFLTDQSFWNLSSLLHNLTYLSLLNSFLFLSTFSVFLENLNNYFPNGLLTSLFSVNKLYYVVFLSFFCIQLFPTFFRVLVFQGPGFLGSRFFRLQVFLGPGFSGSRFFWVRVQGPGPGFRSSHLRKYSP